MSKIIVDTIESTGTTVTVNDSLDAGTNTVTAGTVTGLTATSITSGTLGADRIPANIQAHAWVYFNGTGTVAINDSYNVSSITDLATGYYKVNYSTAAANAHNCPLPMDGHDGIQFGMTMFAGMDGTPANDAIDATGFAFTTNNPSTDVDVDTPDIVAIVFAD